MKRWMVVGVLLVMVMATAAMAENAKDKDAACALLGNCGNDMVESAKAMQVQCNKMMADAEKLMEKGKMIRGQGKLWQDKDMEAEGQNLYNQGKKMYDEAKTMSDTCALIIAEGEKTKKKYKYSGKKSDGKTKVPSGDHVPY